MKQLKLLMIYFNYYSRDNKEKWKEILSEFVGDNIFITLNNLGISYLDFLSTIFKYYYKKVERKIVKKFKRIKIRLYNSIRRR